MRLPVDTSVVHFVSAGPAEPSIDFDTKQQKTDAKGVAINQVHLFVVGDGGTREVITVEKERASAFEATRRFRTEFGASENNLRTKGRQGRPSARRKHWCKPLSVRTTVRTNRAANA